MDLGPYVRCYLLRDVPPCKRFDYVSYPTLIANQLLARGYVRLASDEEDAEIDSPKLYIPSGQPYRSAR